MNNVLHVIDYAAPYEGNFISSLKELNKKMLKNNIKIIYLLPLRAKKNKASTWYIPMTEQGYQVYFMHKNILKNIKLIKNIIKQHNITIIHSHFNSFNNNISIYFANIFKKILHIHHFHCQVTVDSKFKTIIKRVIWKKSILIGVSESVTETLKSVFPKNNCITVENAVFFERLDEKQYIEKMDLASLKCLMFGYNFEIKGVDLAVQAISELRNKYLIDLFIVFTTNADIIVQKIKGILGYLPEWIHFLTPRNDIGSYYNAADIFISPSRSEGLPYVLIEAAYLKKVVVASNCTGQYQKNIPNIFWFKTENLKDFINTLSKAIESKDNLKNELEINSEYVKRYYDLNNWSDKIIDIYNQ